MGASFISNRLEFAAYLEFREVDYPHAFPSVVWSCTVAYNRESQTEKCTHSYRNGWSAVNLQFLKTKGEWCDIPKIGLVSILGQGSPALINAKDGSTPLHARAMSVTTTVYPSSSTMVAESRAVRFESQCVLIPEPQAQSLIHKLGKSLALPLRKRSPEVEFDPHGRAIEERFGRRGGGGYSPK